jgi:hypothetical protein
LHVELVSDLRFSHPTRALCGKTLAGKHVSLHLGERDISLRHATVGVKYGVV